MSLKVEHLPKVYPNFYLTRGRHVFRISTVCLFFFTLYLIELQIGGLHSSGVLAVSLLARQGVQGGDCPQGGDHWEERGADSTPIQPGQSASAELSSTKLVSQFSHSVVSSSLGPYGLQHARLACPSPTPRAYRNSCPLSQ